MVKSQPRIVLFPNIGVIREIDKALVKNQVRGLMLNHGYHSVQREIMVQEVVGVSTIIMSHENPNGKQTPIIGIIISMIPIHLKTRKIIKS